MIHRINLEVRSGRKLEILRSHTWLSLILYTWSSIKATSDPRANVFIYLTPIAKHLTLGQNAFCSYIFIFMGLLSFLFWHCCPFGQVPFVILSQRTWHLPLIQIWPVAQCSCSKQISCEFSGLIFKQLWTIFEHLFLLLQESRHLPFMQIWLMLQSLLSRQLGTQSPLLVKDSSLIFDRWHFYIMYI